jgi:stalled ribosome rescue protein Dom34
MDTAQQFLSQIVIDVAMAAIALLAAYAINAMRKLTEKAKLETKRIQDEAQRKLLTDALDDLETLTSKTVAQIEQTTAKTLREAVKNGVKDKAELEALSKKAFNEIAEALKPESKALIQKNFGNFSKYLTNAIEAKVLELKSGGN